MLLRIKQQMLDILQILSVTRLLPDAVRTSCGQRLGRVFGTKHSHILQVPFSTEKGIVKKWISRFDVWPYLETYTECTAHALQKTKYHFSCQITADLIAIRHESHRLYHH
ncbi:hypothetical protein RND81_02G175300 [Saponaria officinalis]|uniref:sucrose synthase n=1 Tax=Saponaria officinalis TaxID=3572 RepID=A0AAW1MXW9_SAPOF